MCCLKHVGYLKPRHEMRHKTGKVTRYDKQKTLGSMPEETGMQAKFWREL